MLIANTYWKVLENGILQLFCSILSPVFSTLTHVKPESLQMPNSFLKLSWYLLINHGKLDATACIIPTPTGQRIDVYPRWELTKACVHIMPVFTMFCVTVLFFIGDQIVLTLIPMTCRTSCMSTTLYSRIKTMFPYLASLWLMYYA